MSSDEPLPEYQMYQTAVATDLDIVLRAYTKLPEQHPLIQLGIEAALKHVNYCAADIQLQPNVDINLVEEQTFLDSYAESVAHYYLAELKKITSKDPDATLELSHKDRDRMKKALESISSQAFERAVKKRTAIENGEAPQPYVDDMPIIEESEHMPMPEWKTTTSNRHITKVTYQYRLSDEPTPSKDRH